ncbi:MAG: hypothetical protein Fur0010_07740 [Bdellovibrio sp.]
MINLALIGKNISHSKSQMMYEKILGKKINYNLLDYKSENEIPPLGVIFNKLDLQGLSITYPYKRHFLNQVEVDQEVASLGSINCIRKIGDKYLGTNTDFFAMKDILSKLITENSFTSILILGNGNMSEVVKKILDQRGWLYQQLTRSQHGDLSGFDIRPFQSDNSLVINCCSRDMFFNGKIKDNSVFLDVNYGISDGHFKGKKPQSLTYIDGLELLELQAIYALNHWVINKI